MIHSSPEAESLRPT